MSDADPADNKNPTDSENASSYLTDPKQRSETQQVCSSNQSFSQDFIGVFMRSRRIGLASTSSDDPDSGLSVLCTQTSRAQLGFAGSEHQDETVYGPWLLDQDDSGGLVESYRLTPLGSILSRLPLELRLGRVLVFACVLRCADPVLTVRVTLSCT